jgi:ACS family hexuronate transporter-like MFS transporter
MDATPRTRRGIPYFRWVLATMLFLAAILNYVDRQALALLKPTILTELKLTDRDYANINMLFLVAYTAAYLLSGRLVDAWGPRIGMAMFVTWWSLANIATGLARSFATLGSCRFALGLGEAGNWPASTKVVAEWFPARERATAIGFYTLGAAIGATIAPYLILTLAKVHWQAAFVATGLAGLVWAPLWLLIYRSPRRHPLITRADRAALDAEQPAAVPIEPQSEGRRWLQALSLRAVWLLMIARMLTDPVWYFYQQWFPSYLNTARGYSKDQLKVIWVIFLAADIGTISGGLASGLLVRGGRSASTARLVVMLLCAAVMPLSLLISHVSSHPATLALASVVVLAHLAWLSNISALVVDVMPPRLLATCFGITAAGSAMGGIVMNKLVAHFAETHNYPTWFAAMGFLHLLAWAILLVGGVRRSTPNPIAGIPT